MRKHLANIVRLLDIEVEDQGHWRQWRFTFSLYPLFLAPVRANVHEGNGIAALAPELEGAANLGARWIIGFLALHKAVVHGFHQRFCRAEVDPQRVVSALGGLAGVQVAVNVRPPKSVDRLLGVADQEQSPVGGVFCRAVNLIEDPVLNGRGVLELVDQGHRVLVEDSLSQAVCVGAHEGRVQPLQHVLESEGPFAPLEQLQSLLDAPGRVQPCGVLRGGKGAQGGFQASKLLEHGWQGRHRRRPVGAGVLHALRREPCPASLEVRSHQGIFTARPGRQRVQPSRHVLD